MEAPAEEGNVRQHRPFISRIRALTNVVTLFAAIAFVVFLVMSRADATFEWYAARAGLVAILGLLASFIAIVVENRQSGPKEAPPR